MFEGLAYFKRVISAPGYPVELCFFHCLRACASWRAYRHSLAFARGTSASSTGITGIAVDVSRFRLDIAPVSLPFDLVAPYFCHAFGGTTLRDVAIGEAPSLFTSDQVTRHWLMAWLMIYFAPGDIVYKLLQDQRSPIRALSLIYEAIDSATTISGSVEKGIARFPQSTAAPVLLGLIAGVGGSVWRWAEKKGRFEDVKTELAAPTRTFRQTLAYTLTHLWMRSQSSAEHARLTLATFHVLWTLVEEFSHSELDWTLPLMHNLLNVARKFSLL